MILHGASRVLPVLVWCAVWPAGIVGAEPDGCRDGYDGHSYREEVQATEATTLITGFDVNWNTSEFYYVRQIPGGGGLYFAKKLGEKAERYIGKLANGWCEVTVRQDTGDLYATLGYFSDRGGGVYKFDSNANRFERLHYKSNYARRVRFGDVLYYKDYYDKLNTFVRGVSQPVENLSSKTVDDFVVKRSGDVVFLTEGGLYIYDVKTAETTQLFANTTIQNLALGPRGDLYGCDDNAIYLIDIIGATTSKVVDALRCKGLSTDKDDNLIYNNDNANVIYIKKCAN